MNQLLHRGTDIGEGIKIKRLLVGAENWQIYLSSYDTYILAVTGKLVNAWLENGYVSPNLFQKLGLCYCLSSSGDNLISSIEFGPFPDSLEQIEAFSVTFREAVSKFEQKNLKNAIYIEQYSLILPTDSSDETDDIKLVYGSWIAGGIGVSIDSISRISSIMSWLPMTAIISAAQKAGFCVESLDEGKINSNTDEEGQGINTEMGEKPFRLVGRPELEQFFNDNIIDIVLHQAEYKRMGIDFPGATILYGPPGCGKTYAIDRLSEYLGWKRYDINSNSIGSPLIHETGKKIAEVFETAIQTAPSIIVIDEMEAFLMDRGALGVSGAHHMEEIAEFLRRIPEATENNVLIFAMTNMLDAIDPAILRRGRFDHIVEVKMATATEIDALLKEKFVSLPIAEDVVSLDIAQALEGHPLSDVSFVVREAGKMAVKNKMQSIDRNCFSVALEMLPKGEKKKKLGF